MLDVYYTVDTEIWWQDADLKNFRDDFARYFYGKTLNGKFGVAYQLDVLDQHGLHGVFFVEPIFSLAVGMEPLREMVGLIQGRGHDVQLHLHTEWLQHAKQPVVSTRGQHCRDFSEQEQQILIECAKQQLHEAGAQNVNAFRAGNYGANNATLRALAHCGIRYDSSYNFCYLSSACNIETPQPLEQPCSLEGVIEFPITRFRDFPGHFRHLQLRSVSFAELRALLLQAHDAGWQSVVIVSHSFELLNSRRTRPDPIVIDRFERLCEFLGTNRQRFRSATFACEPEAKNLSVRPLTSDIRTTVWRLGEQLARRALFDRR